MEEESSLRDYCDSQCAACARCRYFSYSARWKDCSWYYSCDMARLKTNVAGFSTEKARNSSIMAPPNLLPKRSVHYDADNVDE